jgi:hypothetical protein
MLKTVINFVVMTHYNILKCLTHLKQEVLIQILHQCKRTIDSFFMFLIPLVSEHVGQVHRVNGQFSFEEYVFESYSYSAFKFIKSCVS